ncbi:MAG: outer membrane protein assembly factor BamE, partial [Betaproteobacteria bacterium]
MKHGRFAGAWGVAALAAAAWTGGQAWASPPTAAAAPEAAPAAAAAVPIPNAQAALQTLLSSSVGRADPSLREVAVAGGAAAPAQALPGAAPGRAVV